MANYVAQMQTSLKTEISELRVEVQDISSKAVEHSSDHIALEQRVAHLERSYQEFRHKETQLLLKIDDLDNRGRRNNIKIQGIPEAMTNADLRDTVQVILNINTSGTPTNAA